MNMKFCAAALSVVLLFGCGGHKKQVLVLEDETGKAEAGLLGANESAATVVDTLNPSPGIKFREVRRVDPSDPPLVLKLNGNLPERVFDLADFYSSVSYIVLEFPYKNEFQGFLGDAKYHITFDKGAMFGIGISSRVMMEKDFLIAGDIYVGIYLYDKKGKYLKDIVKAPSFPIYSEVNNIIEIEWDPDAEYLHSISTYGDVVAFTRVKNRKAIINYYSIGKQRIFYSSLLRFNSQLPINEREFLSYTYNPKAKKQMPVFYTLSMKSDTLCRFMNFNPLFKGEMPRAMTDPEGPDNYYLDGKLHIRQAYNDTIYRVESANELTPQYILSYKENKPSIETALSGSKVGKYFISKIKEAEDFLYIVHTSNYDCPNNRNNGAVKFYYSLYDKRQKRFYRVGGGADSIFPEDFTVNNSIKDGFPLNIAGVKSSGKNIYVSYNKLQLRKIIEDKRFSTYSAAQQQKLRSLYSNLPDGALLVVMLWHKLN